MKKVILGLLIVTYASVVVKADNYQNIEKPLFLTPLIESGKISEARQRAVVKHPELKDTQSYAGFLTINKLYNSNTFFWYFPSKNNPKNDPILVWLTGGPGTTSLVGLFVQNGPFIITENQTVEIRKYSWHTNHSIIYIDNPIGTGFSFTDNDKGYVTSHEQIGNDLLTALVQFFKLFPEMRRNGFYVAGSSYAGIYVPSVGHAIKIHNQHSDAKINLKGLAIGNGVTDPITQMCRHDNELFTIGLIDSHDRDRVRLLEENTRKLITEEEHIKAILTFDPLFFRVYTSGQSLFNNMTGYTYYFNFLQTKRPEGISRFVDWVKRPDVRNALHVGSFEFNSSSPIVMEYLKGNFTRSAAHFVEDLLEDYKVFIYHGQLDIIVSYTGTERFVSNLNWSGTKDYKAAQKKIWRVGDKIAGYSKTAKNLNLVLVRNGGHYLPTDQPLWAWDMITRFTHNIDFKDCPA